MGARMAQTTGSTEQGNCSSRHALELLSYVLLNVLCSTFQFYVLNDIFWVPVAVCILFQSLYVPGSLLWKNFLFNCMMFVHCIILSVSACLYRPVYIKSF